MKRFVLNQSETPIHGRFRKLWMVSSKNARHPTALRERSD